MPEVIDDVMRMLAEDGVEIIASGADEADEPKRGEEADRSAGQEPRTWSGFTCARSARCRC